MKTVLFLVGALITAPALAQTPELASAPTSLPSSGEIALFGTISKINEQTQDFVLRAERFTLAGGKTGRIAPPKFKVVRFGRALDLRFASAKTSALWAATAEAGAPSKRGCCFCPHPRKPRPNLSQPRPRNLCFLSKPKAAVGRFVWKMRAFSRLLSFRPTTNPRSS